MAYRRRRFRRRPHHFRKRLVGFSDPFNGPLYRAIFSLIGVKRNQRRSAFNVLALTGLIITTFVFGLSSCASSGLGAGIGMLLTAAILGWIVITVCRYYR